MRRARTKGKGERPFFYLEQHVIKGRAWPSFAHFLADLATFERDELDLLVHHTTRERPVDCFATEAPHLLPLPGQRFLGTLAVARKVSWDCLVSYGGSRYSVPAAYAGKLVWVLPSRGTTLVVRNDRREVIAEHPITARKGATVLNPDHYAALRRRTPSTAAALTQEFLARFPQQAAFLDGLAAQHRPNLAVHLGPILELAALYEPASLERACALAGEYRTYSHHFIRGLLESEASLHTPAVGAEGPDAARPVSRPPRLDAPIPADLAVYQQLLEVQP